MGYGVDNGFDAWRRLYNHYLPPADDLQQILIQELCALRPVLEHNIDTLFNQVERITELYTRGGKTDGAISDKWIKVAVLRDLPKQVTKDFALQFKDANIVNDVSDVVNVYLHDHQTGTPREQSGPLSCATTSGHAETNSVATANGTVDSSAKQERAVSNNTFKDEQNSWQGGNDFYATIEGNGKGKEGGKVYGEYWHCGGWGHPRRECPHLN